MSKFQSMMDYKMFNCLQLGSWQNHHLPKNLLLLSLTDQNPVTFFDPYNQKNFFYYNHINEAMHIAYQIVIFISLALYVPQCHPKMEFIYIIYNIWEFKKKHKMIKSWCLQSLVSPSIFLATGVRSEIHQLHTAYLGA